MPGRGFTARTEIRGRAPVRTGNDTHNLSDEQMAVLKTASPEELGFIVLFARNYINGRKFACWGARALVALGALAGAGAAVSTFLHSIGWLR